MKKITIEILQIISAVIILSAGFAFTFRYLDGRMLIGICLIIAGISLLVRMVVSAR